MNPIATPMAMTKEHGPIPAYPEGWSKAGWDKYVREHNKKLRKAYREADGDNMESPPETDYK